MGCTASLALCNPRGMTRIALQSGRSVARSAASGGPTVGSSEFQSRRPAMGLIRHDTLICGCSLGKKRAPVRPGASLRMQRTRLATLQLLWTSEEILVDSCHFSLLVSKVTVRLSSV